jgi:hypothetical protein
MTVKAGLLTTEFWFTALTAVGTLAAALAGELPPRWAAIASAVSAAAYAISRAITKNGALSAPAAVATTGPVTTTPPNPPQTV